MSQRIAGLTAGQIFTKGRFQIHSVRGCHAATGPYLFLRLGEETSRITAIRWNATDAEQKHALIAQVVFVSGHVRTKAGFPIELEIIAFECLPCAQDVALESVFLSLTHEAEVDCLIQRTERVARILFGAETGNFQRQELSEAELRHALDRMYTLGRNAPRQAPAQRPFTVPVGFPICDEGD